MLQNFTILEVKSNFRQQWFEWQIMLTSWLNSHTADLLTASGWSITVLFLSFCLHVFLCPSLYHSHLFCWLFLVSYSLHYVVSLLSLSFSLSVSFCVSGQISLQSVATPLFILIAIWGQWLFKASRSKPSVFLISLSLSHSFPLSCSFLCSFILVSLSLSLIHEAGERSGPVMCGSWAFRSFSFEFRSVGLRENVVWLN